MKLTLNDSKGYSGTMCGLAGFSLAPHSKINANVLAGYLLLGIEERGRHATGVAWEEEDTIYIFKEPIPAREFIKNYQRCPKATKTALLHTRWATKGSAKEWVNNHPIDHHGIVGVHNGVLWNDDDIFDRIGTEHRKGEVDSEAAFALLARSGNPTTQSLEELKGSATLAWMDTASPTIMHLARVSSSPLHIARLGDGSLIFGSTGEALRSAAKGIKQYISFMYGVEEGVYFSVENGRILDRQYFATRERALTAIERQALSV